MRFFESLFHSFINICLECFINKHKKKFAYAGLCDQQGAYNNSNDGDTTFPIISIYRRAGGRDGRPPRSSPPMNKAYDTQEKTTTRRSSKINNQQNQEARDLRNRNPEDRQKSYRENSPFPRAMERKRRLLTSADNKKSTDFTKYSLVDQVQEARNIRLSDEDDRHIKSSMMQVIRKSKQNRAEQVNRLGETLGLDDAEREVYISALSKQVEGKGIVNPQLKAIGIVILAMLLLIFLIGTFLNKNNPIIPLIQSINKPLVIKIVDQSNTKIFEVKRLPQGTLSEQNISRNLENTFLALQGLNELLYQKTKQLAAEQNVDVSEIVLDRDKITQIIEDYAFYMESPYEEDGVIPQKGIFTSIVDFILFMPNWFMGLFSDDYSLSGEVIENKVEVVNPFNANPLEGNEPINSEPEEAVITNRDFVINNCKIFIVPSDVSDSNCEFSSVNIIMNKLYTPATEGWLVNYINPIKAYLLTNWLKKKVSLRDFFALFFNITYFGNYQIGIKSSYSQYFKKTTLESIDIPRALFMMKNLYDNNKNFYPNYDITNEHILDMMIANGYVPEDKKEAILTRVNNIVVNVEPPKSPFAVHLNELFLSGYSYFPEYYDISVQTTLSSKLQSVVSGVIVDKLKGFNIPAGSVIALNKNRLVVALSIKIIDGKVNYLDKYPKGYVYNSVKPFLYLTLLENKKDASALLLNNRYQNLIFSNKRLEHANLTAKEYSADNDPTFAGIETTEEKVRQILEELNFLKDDNVDDIPNGLKKSFADRLNYLEGEFFSELTEKDYYALFNRLGLVKYAEDFNLNSLYDGKLKVELVDLAKAYSIFINDGNMLNSKLIDNVNGIPQLLSQEKILSVRTTYTNLLKDIYFNTIISKHGKEFYIMIDFQTAVVFNDEYIGIIWLGDFEGDENYKDTTLALEHLVKDLINMLK